MRITGLASGLDMDKIVTDSMKPYRVKVDQTKQKRDIVEMKQQLYRDVIKDSRDLYNKYFDVSKPDSLLLSSNYGINKFTSSNENILSVNGGADSKAESYKITGTTGTAAKAVVTTGIIDGEKLVLNGKEFTLKGTNEKEIAKNLNIDLKKEGINVSVRYSDFAGTTNGNQKGLIFESTVLGKDSTFIIGSKPTEAGSKILGTDATAATVSGFNINDLKSPGKSVLSINGEDIEIEISDTDTDDDIEKLIKEKISGKNLSVKIDENKNITFSSTVLGSSVSDMDIKIDGKLGIFKSGYDATKTTNTIDLSIIKDKKITVNGNVIDLSKAETGKEEEYLNKILESQGIEAKLDGNNIVLTSKSAGSSKKIDINVFDDNGSVTVDEGNNTEIIFTDSKGGVYKHTGTSNTVTLDGVVFKFTGEIPKDGITVNGKIDSKDTKDKLVKFVEDYNVLIEKLNKMTMEKVNKNYQPLTDEERKEMSETEANLWDEKVRQGRLNRDSDITRLSNSMKSIMSSMSGQLEKIGISPVKDYQGTKNGTLTIDESKLTMALENDAEGVMTLFTENKKDLDGKETKGIMHKLKDVLYNETVTVKSSLIKKAGIENSSTSSNNELTKSIEKYNKKMADLEKDFARREQALYSKYARLEVAMNKYNSQQSMMAQQIGGQ